MAEKAVYSLTNAGEKEFENLSLEISAMPVRFFLDLNAVIVNLSSLSPVNRELCLTNIADGVKTLKAYLEENIKTKENVPDIPETGLAVLTQQFILAEAIETWIASLKDNLK